MKIRTPIQCFVPAKAIKDFSAVRAMVKRAASESPKSVTYAAALKQVKAFIAIMLVPVMAFAADVTFSFKDFTGNNGQLQRKTVQIDPLSAVLSPDNVVTVAAERRFYNLGTNTIITVSNMVYGSYLISIFGTTRTSIYRIYIPDTNGTINAAGYITATGNNLLLTDGTYLRLSNP
jgi:hypothetical protein